MTIRAQSRMPWPRAQSAGAADPAADGICKSKKGRVPNGTRPFFAGCKALCIGQPTGTAAFFSAASCISFA